MAGNDRHHNAEVCSAVAKPHRIKAAVHHTPNRRTAEFDMGGYGKALSQRWLGAKRAEPYSADYFHRIFSGRCYHSAPILRAERALTSWICLTFRHVIGQICTIDKNVLVFIWLSLTFLCWGVYIWGVCHGNDVQRVLFYGILLQKNVTEGRYCVAWPVMVIMFYLAILSGVVPPKCFLWLISFT